jgi:hypothetical protein
MSRARIPFIVVMVGALTAAFLVERDQAPSPPVPAALDLFRAAPMVAAADVLGSTWYCAAGSSDGEGPADHTVVVANPTDTDRHVELTAFPGQASPVATELVVPAGGLERVRVSDIVESPATAVMVEIPGGELAVTHDLVGPTGRDSGPCASTSSQVWHFAWGDTSRDARSLVALFNPFPGDAVVDFRFVTIDGPRSPQALSGVVVPGQSVVVVDVGAEIARRDQVSATVTARSGRVVAERLQSFDDTEEMLEGAEPRRALTVDLGTPVPMETWIFPSVRLVEGLTERVVIYNPGQATAEVDLEVLTTDPGQAVEPFELTVPPNGYEVLVLSTQARLTELLDDGPLEATLVVRSLNDVPVVAERVTQVPTSADGPGVSATAGTPLVGRRLVVVDPRPAGAEAATLTLVNLDTTELVSGSITVLSRGVSRPLEGSGVFELGPAGRLTVDLVGRVSGSATSILLIETNRPVAAGVVTRTSGPADRIAHEAIVASGDAEPPSWGLGG